MPVYAYKAADASGKIVTGSLEAPDEKGAAAGLHDMGCIPIRIRLDQGGAGGGLRSLLSVDVAGFFQRVSGKDVMLFTQDLATLLQAGLPIDRSLSILINVVESERFKRVVADILKAIQGGSYLSDALAMHPRAFSGFYINMVRAGEAGGVLEAVLERMGIFLESAQELREYIKSALVYPIFLVCVGGISIIILMTFVIPKFSMIFADMGRTVPLATRILLAASDGIRGYWWAMLLVAGGAVAWLRRYARTAEGQLKLDRRKLKTPVVGDFVRKMEVARFARTLGTLVQSGVPILQALLLVKDIIANRVISESLQTVYNRVKEGERLAKPLTDTGMFPPLAIQMITVGEETGKLDAMLLRVADNYEKIVKNTVKRFISFLEPAMILFMGFVVGAIVISMLMAIFSMNDIPF